MYSVIQSDGNSFLGDVILDSFNMAYGDEGSILDQKYENQRFLLLRFLIKRLIDEIAYLVLLLC